MFQLRLFFSPAAVPGGIAPESLTFTPLDDMIFLKWEEPVEPNGLITQYEVGYIVSHAKKKKKIRIQLPFHHRLMLCRFRMLLSPLYNDSNQEKVSPAHIKDCFVPPSLFFFISQMLVAHKPEPLEWGEPTFHSSWDLLYMFIW